MTTVFFIRHAESDLSVHDDRIRPLTEKGMNDRSLVTGFLQDKSINAVLSSPFRRAVDTVADFAERNGIEIETIEDFRERDVGGEWLSDADFWAFVERAWADFSYTRSGDECLAKVQERNIAALNAVLHKHEGQNIAIGTHGTAMSTIINYYDRSYRFQDFMAIVKITPWVVKMEFNGTDFIGMEKIDLFNS